MERMEGWKDERTLTARSALYDFLAVLAVSLVVVASVIYAEVRYIYDARTFLLCILLPLVFGVAVLSLRKDRTLLFAFLAMFWAVIDDRPIFFDSILTWPEVTRFHPFLPRLFMNVVIHALTIIFLYLTIREAMKGSGVRMRKVPLRVIILATVSFAFAYAQNIPLAVIQNVVQAGANPASWFPFDLEAKLSAIFFLCLAVWQAKKLKSHKRTNIAT
jgi:hypothetical protein